MSVVLAGVDAASTACAAEEFVCAGVVLGTLSGNSSRDSAAEAAGKRAAASPVDCKIQVCAADWGSPATVSDLACAVASRDADASGAHPCTGCSALVDRVTRDDGDRTSPCVAAALEPFAPFAGTSVVPGKAPGKADVEAPVPRAADPWLPRLASAKPSLAFDAAS